MCYYQNSLAQGLYTQFGKNRVESNNFKWQNISNTLVTIYYHDNGYAVANNAIEITTNETPSVEKLLGSAISQAVIVILYNNIHEYQQSNLELANAAINPAGFNTIRQNIFPVYFDGDYNHLKKQLRQALANALLTDFFYGGSIQEKVSNNVLLSLPDWYYKGLLSYISESWNVTNDDEMRDKIESGGFQNFNLLTKEEEVLAGKSLWYYLAVNNKSEAIASIVFWTKYERSAENALLRTTGKTMKSLLNNWRSWFENRYAEENRLGNMPRGTENSPSKIASAKHTRFTISPNGKYMAIVTNKSGLVKVWLYNTSNKNTKLLYKTGYKSQNITPDNTYPLIAWHPNSRKIGIITYHNRKDQLKEVNISNLSSKFISIGNHDGIIDFIYSPSGDSLVLSAFSNGQSDLFWVDVKKKVISNITNDIYYDANPSFLPNGEIVFASRRPIIKINNEQILDVSNYPTSIHRITSQGILPVGMPKTGANYYAPLYYGSNLITCLTDESGVINAVVCAINDSSNFVFVSNYKRNIIYQDIAQASGQLAELILFKEKYYIYLSDLADDVLKESQNIIIKPTTFRNKNPIGQEVFNTKGSIKKVPNEPIKDIDSTPKKLIDTPKIDSYFITNFPIIDYQLNTGSLATLQPSLNETGAALRSPLYINYVVTQTDNSNLGFPYFPLEADSFAMLIPFFSFNIAAEAADLYRNYVFNAGMRFHLDLRGHDYRIGFQALKFKVDFEAGALKRKRVFGNVGNTRQFNQGDVWAGASYPFSERSKIKFILGGKQDQVLYGLDKENSILDEVIDRKLFYYQAQWVVDNSIDKGLNKIYGLRTKIYAEQYHLLNQGGLMTNLGFDLRRIIPIWGELAWATRLSGAFSVSKLKTIYYLGGEETDIFPNYSTIIPFARDPNYIFLVMAPTLRGYARNTSHGFANAVLNNELRFPIISHFYKAPMYNNFLKSFTISSFLDIGSAWKGINPYQSEIPSNTVQYVRSNYTVTATSPGNPWLLGSGFGVRALILGYFVKFERGWGVKNGNLLPGLNYITIGLDF